MAQPFKTDSLVPSSLPSATLGRRRHPTAQSRPNPFGTDNDESLLEGISPEERDQKLLDREHERWNERIDKEIGGMVGALKEIVELADIGSSPSSLLSSTLPLHLRLRTSSLIRGSQNIRDLAHELKLLLLLGDEQGTASRRDREHRKVREEVRRKRQQVGQVFGETMGVGSATFESGSGSGSAGASFFPSHEAGPSGSESGSGSGLGKEQGAQRMEEAGGGHNEHHEVEAPAPGRSEGPTAEVSKDGIAAGKVDLRNTDLDEVEVEEEEQRPVGEDVGMQIDNQRGESELISGSGGIQNAKPAAAAVASPEMLGNLILNDRQVIPSDNNNIADQQAKLDTSTSTDFINIGTTQSSKPISEQGGNISSVAPTTSPAASTATATATATATISKPLDPTTTITTTGEPSNPMDPTGQTTTTTIHDPIIQSPSAQPRQDPTTETETVVDVGQSISEANEATSTQPQAQSQLQPEEVNESERITNVDADADANAGEGMDVDEDVNVDVDPVNTVTGTETETDSAKAELGARAQPDSQQLQGSGDYDKSQLDSTGTGGAVVDVTVDDDDDDEDEFEEIS